MGLQLLTLLTQLCKMSLMGHRQGVQCWVFQQYHQMPDRVRFLFPVFPLISPFMSCYILICGCYLLRLNSAFFSPSPSSAGLGLPTACCVQCPAAGREWRAVSVSSHTQQPWVVAMAQHQSKLGERTGNVDCGSVILSLAWFLDKPEVVCGPGRRGGLMGSLGM